PITITPISRLTLPTPPTPTPFPYTTLFRSRAHDQARRDRERRQRRRPTASGIHVHLLRSANPHTDGRHCMPSVRQYNVRPMPRQDRKSTRLNSSHQIISYAVFCLKKKKTRT